jgi:hypothetical protein
MKGLNTTIVLCLLLVCAGSLSATNPQTAQRYGVDTGKIPQQTLADPSGDGAWHEYDKTADIPALAGGAAAFVWTGVGGKQFILLQEATEDWDTFTSYCFDPRGRLWRLGYELRTAWGWGFRERGLIASGKLRVETSGFFDTSNERAIPKPESADDIPEALKPDLYLMKSKLPFFKLLVERLPSHGSRAPGNPSKKTKG